MWKVILTSSSSFYSRVSKSSMAQSLGGNRAGIETGFLSSILRSVCLMAFLQRGDLLCNMLLLSRALTKDEKMLFANRLFNSDVFF